MRNLARNTCIMSSRTSPKYSDITNSNSNIKIITIIRAMIAAAAILTIAPSASAQLPPTFADVTYATVGGAALKLDLYIPPSGSPGSAPQPYPLVIWIHGGGWSGGDKFPANSAGLLMQHGFA